MPKDILFKNEDFIFSYRVAGILRRGDKILLQKPKDDDYSLIGGHISAMELSADTLVREFQEEIHAKIGVDELIAVGEIFFPWGKRPCHQISLYYNVHLLDERDIPMEGVFHGYDDLDNERINLDFCWVDIQQLKAGVTVYPQELIPHILSGSKEILHFVSNQIER
ncbi:MAG: NUDIX hydrolase [Faecousia sp.]